MKKLLVTVIAVSIFANVPASAADSNFFIKANAGFSKLNKISNLKSENSSFIGAGVGYNIMDNVRADIMFDHFVNPTFKAQGKKTKADINTFLLNGYIDLFDISITKLFVGTGAGIAHTKIKKINSVSAKSTAGNNFSYAAYIGVSTEFVPSFHGELVYSWRDFAVQKDNDLGLKGHHVAAGIRFDI
ncbi:putative adhesin [Nosema granulosis]|uniref:Adhesin n=1 Tax=Nosema granulosis TaxID=83296 RepID=A0A9P6GWB5_9MICR|nr:putative adhesin [Nosema granulosis]